MEERLSDKNPCKGCCDSCEANYPGQEEGQMCKKQIAWANECIKKLAEYETAEKYGNEWILVRGDEFDETYRCSKCGHEVTINIEIYREDLPDCCPSCGKRMILN